MRLNLRVMVNTMCNNTEEEEVECYNVDIKSSLSEIGYCIYLSIRLPVIVIVTPAPVYQGRLTPPLGSVTIWDDWTIDKNLI